MPIINILARNSKNLIDVTHTINLHRTIRYNNIKS